MSECLLDGEMSKATVNRQAFEDWIRVTTRTCGHDFDEGKYVCHLIQMRWAAWQEATRQALESPAAVGDMTLHSAIDYWQERAHRAEKERDVALTIKACPCDGEAMCKLLADAVLINGELDKRLQSALDIIEIEGLDEDGSLRIGPDNTEKLIKLMRGE